MVSEGFTDISKELNANADDFGLDEEMLWARK